MSVTFWRLGRNVRFVLLLAWETLCPTSRPLPVSSQTRDMVIYPDFSGGALRTRRAPPVSRLRAIRQRRGGSRAATQQQYLRWLLEAILKVTTMRAVLFVLIVAI